MSSPSTLSKPCFRSTLDEFCHTPAVVRSAPVLVLMTALECPQLLTEAPDWIVTPVERLLDVNTRKPPLTRQLAEWLTPARSVSTLDRSEKTKLPARALVCA